MTEVDRMARLRYRQQQQQQTRGETNCHVISLSLSLSLCVSVSLCLYHCRDSMPDDLTVCVVDYELNCAITVLHVTNNLTNA